MDTIANPAATDDRLRRFAIGFYSWIYTVYFGLVVLDVVYARQLTAALGASLTAGIFSEISDFLQFPLGLILLSGFAALGASLKSVRVVSLLTVSWLLPIAALVFSLFFAAELDASGYGSALRLLTFGLGSSLAALAFLRFLREESEGR